MRRRSLQRPPRWFVVSVGVLFTGLVLWSVSATMLIMAVLEALRGLT